MPNRQQAIIFNLIMIVYLPYNQLGISFLKTIVFQSRHIHNMGPYQNRTRLTHWVRVTHICVSKLTIIGSDNGLSPGRRQAIIWTNAGILLIRPLRTNVSEILIEIHIFSFKKIHLKTSSAKWRPFRLGLNVFKKDCAVVTTRKVKMYISLNYITTMISNHTEL